MNNIRHIFYFALLTFTLAIPAQEETATIEQGTIDSLAALQESIRSNAKEILAAQNDIKEATDVPTRTRLEEKLQLLQHEQSELKSKFETIAIGTDGSIFENDDKAPFNVQKELEKLAKPIFAEINNATADSRLIEELRSELAHLQKRHEVAATAVTNLKLIVEGNTNAALQGALEAELQTWDDRRKSAKNQATAVEYQLQTKRKERESLLDSGKNFFANFFQSRGLNLILGVAAFCGIFFGSRFLYYLYRKMRPIGEVRTFGSRLGTMVFHLFSIILSIFAIVFVFNMRGDWFLLGLTLIFLIGVGWGGINTIPVFFDQLKLMLNFGAVKEKERIIFDGVPWEVDTLSLYARLVNPLLDGGVQDLPIRSLLGRHSRPKGENEEWFPSREGDWVELSDGNIGKVSYQTPEFVQLVLLGGSQVMYQTPAYLALNPKNMTTNFRVSLRFGVDYQHQSIATTEIPEKMQAKLTAGLNELLGAENIKRIKVEFAEAGASSLDYEINADIAGTAANKYDQIIRAIPRHLVDACNENGWVIPFTQITLHQAT